MEHDSPDETMGSGRWSGLLRSVVLPIGVLAIIVGGLWYWDARGGGGDDRYGVVELPAEKNATDESPRAEIGRAGPDFLLATLDGGELRLSDLQGGPVVINFWATWCFPCRDEMPVLVRAYNEHADEGLTIVGINLQEADSQVRKFADEFGIEFPIVMDRDAELGSVWRLGGAFDGIPTTYVLDAKGIVRASFLGPLTEERLNEELEAVLPVEAN